ncbi:hypothetical protein GGS23DRAFT_520434 [Durotheca rogersii]|uniref:uncharacterized protein n=1 Tax=Durotheca rogersii TaxID=419775 RepID=UPI00221F3D39|nr:uncharacterized protein GGS23DRAFT_520434 [Durotheca rogersii]KAI5863913.1 hypothetical protein GGS23DRAFT_520434 [Durotheca rogersii]
MSAVPGFVDLGGRWLGRKPHRQHRTSTASNAGSIIGCGSSTDDNSNNVCESENEDAGACGTASFLYTLDGVQHRPLDKYSLNSCPDFHQQPYYLESPPSKAKSREDQRLGLRARSKLSPDPNPHRFPVRSVVTRRVRLLGKRLQQSESSDYSIRSGFPVSPQGKERRRLARDLTGIWPSHEETPLIDTPGSDAAICSPADAHGRRTDLLAMAGAIIATVELDRLSRANYRGALNTLRSPSDFRGAPPTPQVPLHSSGASLDTDTAITGDNAPGTLPPVPFNLAASEPVSLAPRQPRHAEGQRRRARWSYLSEVATLEEAASTAEAANGYEGTPPTESLETLARDGDGNLNHKLSGVNRSVQRKIVPPNTDPARHARENPLTSTSMVSSHPSVPSGPPQSPPRLPDDSSTDTRQGSPTPNRVSSIGGPRTWAGDPGGIPGGDDGTSCIDARGI